MEKDKKHDSEEDLNMEKYNDNEGFTQTFSEELSDGWDWNKMAAEQLKKLMNEKRLGES